ncbi:MAG: hypothetical protein ABI581_10955 [Sediminibacterium sp.]
MIGDRFQNYYSFFVGLLLTVLSTSAGAQPLNFIYIQTENNQSYKLDWNERVYFSSTTGYLVIPQVSAGKHLLSISFSNEVGETATYAFTVESEEKPRGFTLRQAIDNGWSLLDLVDFTFIKGMIAAPVVKTEIPAAVTNPMQLTVKEDKPVAVAERPVVKKDPVNKERASGIPTGILKIFDKNSTGGIDQVYVLTTGNRSDTIALFIPVIADKNEPGSGSNPTAFLLSKLNRPWSMVHGLWTSGRKKL